MLAAGAQYVRTMYDASLEGSDMSEIKEGASSYSRGEVPSAATEERSNSDSKKKDPASVQK